MHVLPNQDRYTKIVWQARHYKCPSNPFPRPDLESTHCWQVYIGVSGTDSEGAPPPPQSAVPLTQTEHHVPSAAKRILSSPRAAHKLLNSNGWVAAALGSRDYCLLHKHKHAAHVSYCCPAGSWHHIAAEASAKVASYHGPGFAAAHTRSMRDAQTNAIPSLRCCCQPSTECQPQAPHAQHKMRCASAWPARPPTSIELRSSSLLHAVFEGRRHHGAVGGMQAARNLCGVASRLCWVNLGAPRPGKREAQHLQRRKESFAAEQYHRASPQTLSSKNCSPAVSLGTSCHMMQRRAWRSLHLWLSARLMARGSVTATRKAMHRVRRHSKGRARVHLLAPRLGVVGAPLPQILLQTLQPHRPPALRG